GYSGTDGRKRRAAKGARRNLRPRGRTQDHDPTALVHTTIVSVDELALRLKDAAWVIVDCRHLLQDFDAGRRMYEAAHIPGAFYASGEDDLAGPKTGSNGRHPLPDPERFAAFLREL